MGVYVPTTVMFVNPPVRSARVSKPQPETIDDIASTEAGSSVLAFQSREDRSIISIGLVCCDSEMDFVVVRTVSEILPSS